MNTRLLRLRIRRSLIIVPSLYVLAALILGDVTPSIDRRGNFPLRIDVDIDADADADAGGYDEGVDSDDGDENAAEGGAASSLRRRRRLGGLSLVLDSALSASDSTRALDLRASLSREGGGRGGSGGGGSGGVTGSAYDVTALGGGGEG